MQGYNAQALLDLGEVLSGALSPATCGRLRSNGTALAGLATAALHHRICGATWLELCRHGICMPLPEMLRARLPEGHPVLVLENGWRIESERARNLVLQATHVIATLNAAGIVPMLLKGMALLLGGALPEEGRRWMVDVDIMVRPEELDVAMAALGRAGYHQSPVGSAPHHAPPLVREEGGFEVEVHFAMVVPPLQPALPTAAVWADAQLHERDGLRFCCPSPQDNLLHVALHGQESRYERQLACVPFRALADFVGLWRSVGPGVDWPALRKRAAAAGLCTSFDIHLYQSCRLFGQKWPLPRLPGLLVRLHWRLCLAAADHPGSVAQALASWLELRQLASATIKGRGTAGGVAAGLALAGRMIFKYRWRLIGRLMGNRK